MDSERGLEFARMAQLQGLAGDGAAWRIGFACEMKSDTFPLVKKNRAEARNRRKVSLTRPYCHSSRKGQHQSTPRWGFLTKAATGFTFSECTPFTDTVPEISAGLD